MQSTTQHQQQQLHHPESIGDEETPNNIGMGDDDDEREGDDDDEGGDDGDMGEGDEGDISMTEGILNSAPFPTKDSTNSSPPLTPRIPLVGGGEGGVGCSLGKDKEQRNQAYSIRTCWIVTLQQPEPIPAMQMRTMPCKGPTQETKTMGTAEPTTTQQPHHHKTARLRKTRLEHRLVLNGETWRKQLEVTWSNRHILS